MAGHGYVTKGYNTYNEIEPTTYQGYVCNDHVCRPVIVDAEGRKKPIISYTTSHNTPGYVTKRETIVERVHTPEYTYNSPPKVEMFKDYGVNNDKWRRPSSPIHERHPEEYDEFITKVPTEVSHPTKTSLPNTTNYWQTTTSPTYTYGHHNGGTNGYGHEWTNPKSHPLTTTTNDIGEAVDFLRHAINAVPQSQPWVQKRETYTETIDSSEAAQRYARPVFKQPVHETYTGNIDSREAVWKYNGTIVP